MVIDAHHHLSADWEPYVEKLRAECARLRIDRVAVAALYGGAHASNEQTAAALRAHPDLLLGYGWVELGVDPPARVDELRDRGFHGLKFIWPHRNYDDDAFLPVYERAEALGMPALFHLGIVARQAEFDRLMDVSMARMQVVFLDRIARRFPGLTILGAHLGNPDYHVAGELARMHPNVFFDLTGSTLKKKGPEFIGEVFWWARNPQYGKMGHGLPPYQKLIFGTDVGVELMEDVRSDYQAVMDALEMTPEDRAAILGGTAAKWFGLE